MHFDLKYIFKKNFVKPFICCIFAQMPNKKAKDRKQDKKKANQAVKAYKRAKKARRKNG